MKRRVFVASWLIAAVATGCQTPQGTPVPSRWERTRLAAALQIAEERLNAGKFEQARAALEPLRRLDESGKLPYDPRVQLTEARIDIEQGEYAAALRRLDGLGGAAAPASSGASARAPFGGREDDLGLTPSAGFEPDPGPAAGVLDDPELLARYHHLRGVALEGLGRWEQAAGAYEQAYRVQPSVHCLTAWVDALALADRLDAARKVLERERRSFPGEPVVQMLAARLYQQLGEPQAAVAELESALLAQPESAAVRRALAEAYAASGRHADAARAWRELIAECQDTTERQRLRHRLAAVLMSAGRFEQARTTYRLLALTHPDDSAAQLGLAAACLADNRPAEALAAALEVLRTDADNSDARLIAALSYRRLDQPARAAELLSDLGAGGERAELARMLLTHWD